MDNKKKHLDVGRFVETESYRSRRIGRSVVVPNRDRNSHGSAISSQYQNILNTFEQRASSRLESITDDSGLYVEITGYPNLQLPLDKLDNTSFRLCVCKKEDDREIATVFIPENKRDIFMEKINQYLDPSKDGVRSPRNHALIDGIESVRFADIRSFWTDAQQLFPQVASEKIWWELWLKKGSSARNPFDIAQQFAARIDAQLAATTLSFFGSVVVLIKASVEELEAAVELISNLSELRKPKDTPTAIVDSSPYEQAQWIENIVERIEPSQQNTTSVVILDSGVNYHNPLLGYVCNENLAVTWDSAWPPYDTYPFRTTYAQHGSQQAGLAVFGDVLNVALSTGSIISSNQLEFCLLWESITQSCMAILQLQLPPSLKHLVLKSTEYTRWR